MATKEQKARVRAERAKSGGRQISASLTGEEAALLDEVKSMHPELNQKSVIVAALRSLKGRNQPTNAELLALISERLGD